MAQAGADGQPPLDPEFDEYQAVREHVAKLLVAADTPLVTVEWER